jgi:hypothetical protein
MNGGKPTALMARWVAAHLGAGAFGALAAYPGFLGLFNVIGASADEWFYVILLAYLAALLVILTVPILAYQAIALRHALVPRRWIGFTVLALLPAPALLFFGTGGLLRLIQGPFPFGEEDASSRWIFTGLSGWVLAGFAIGLLWIAPIQWFALQGIVPFRRWWLYAGPSLGVAATVVVAAFMCALIREPIWLALLPLGALIYAVGVYPAIRPLLRTSAAGA